VGNHRKQIAVVSEDPMLARAVRLRLAYDVELVDGISDLAGDYDALIVDSRDRFDFGTLEEVTASAPTLVLANGDRLIDAVDAGCRGFLQGSASLDEISDAVSTIVAGGAVVAPDLMGALLRHLVERRRQRGSLDDKLNALTSRERQVFHLAAGGARKEEIGDQLFISSATARTHLQNVYRKLGIHSQAELMGLAKGDANNGLEEME
jgi:DNA-binding NarL/FixJ family response regulator